MGRMEGASPVWAAGVHSRGGGFVSRAVAAGPGGRSLRVKQPRGQFRHSQRRNVTVAVQRVEAVEVARRVVPRRFGVVEWDRDAWLAELLHGATGQVGMV